MPVQQRSQGISELPRELIEKVFEELLDDTLSLSNCTLVSKHLFPSAQRLLFRRIHLNYLSYDASRRHYVQRRSPQRRHHIHPRVWVPDFEGFRDLITRNRTMASYVLDLKITGIIPVDGPLLLSANVYRDSNMIPPWTTLDPLLLSNLLCALPSLSQLMLRHLVLQGSNFTSHHINPLPRLESLKLDNVGAYESHTISQAIAFFDSKNLYVNCLYSQINLLEPTHYHSFLHLTHARGVEIAYLPDASQILAALRASPSLQSLSLSLRTVSDLRELSKLFMSSAELQDLFIDLSTSTEQALSMQGKVTVLDR